MLLGQFFAGFLTGSGRGAPSFQEADDASRDALLPNAVSLINLASIHDFERVARQPVDPRRFRGNILIEGLPAWTEFGWLGNEVRIGGATQKGVRRIARVAATNVNPDPAEPEMNTPLTLHRQIGKA